MEIHKIETYIWIPGNVPALKSGRIKTRYSLVESKLVKKWKKETKGYWESKHAKIMFTNLVKLSGGMPIFLHMTFIRGTGALFDYMGAGETICDELVYWNWINDDNAYQIVPVFGKFKVDSKNPGVELRVLSQVPKYEFL